jgi:hypothetical protein
MVGAGRSTRNESLEFVVAGTYLYLRGDATFWMNNASRKRNPTSTDPEFGSATDSSSADSPAPQS